MKKRSKADAQEVTLDIVPEDDPIHLDSLQVLRAIFRMTDDNRRRLVKIAELFANETNAPRN